MELSWDNCLPSLFVLQCCIVSDTVLLRKKNLWHTSTKWIYIELRSVLLLSLVHPHTRSQVAFYLSLKVQYVEHLTLEKVSVVLQGHAAAPLEVVLLFLCFYFAKKDKCSKQHKAKTDHSRLGSTVLHLIKEKAISGKSSSFLHVRLTQALCNSDSVSHLEIQCGITLQYGLALPRYHPYFSSCHTIFW